MTRITAVVPSFRRRAALLTALPNHLSLDGVDEVIVVDDGSEDGTAEAVEALADPRLRLVRHPANRGLPAARNSGARAARGEYVLYLEDDCGFPADYATRLLDTAVGMKADVVGAPWTHLPHNAAAATASEHPVDHFTLTTPPWTFPTVPTETPFMPALCLVRRAVFEAIQYDEGYRGNFYREETDFYLAARRAGFKVVLTPTTWSWQLADYGGGCRRPRLAADFWAMRNTGRMLRKHGKWMRSNGLLATPWPTLLARFAWTRFSYYPRRLVRAPRWVWRRIGRAA